MDPEDIEELQPNRNVKISNLSQVSFEELVDCFLLAFENYYVKMPSDPEYYRNRWTAAKVNFDLSYGMFDRGRLVGFIIHAVDTRFGIKTAFNTGTGVIPEFRGQRITSSIYEMALKDLRYNGIEKCSLEVIQENKKAIRAYQGAGFEICKGYHCFSGPIQLGPGQDDIQLKKLDKKEFDWSAAPDQRSYSWDFQRETIEKRENEFYQVIHDTSPESFFIFNRENKYLAQFDLYVNDTNAWDRLFRGVSEVSEEVRIINVDDQRIDKLDAIAKANVTESVKQYEMELEIASSPT